MLGRGEAGWGKGNFNWGKPSSKLKDGWGMLGELGWEYLRLRLGVRRGTELLRTIRDEGETAQSYWGRTEEGSCPAGVRVEEVWVTLGGHSVE